MPTMDDVITAIRNADAVGDSAAVRQLGGVLKQMNHQVRVQQQQQADKEQYSPTKGMSGFEKFRAGFGKAFSDVGQGVGQLVGLVDQDQVDETKRNDQALMNTGAGLAGNISGNVAAALPTAFIPGAATLPGAAAVGAGLGFAQPVGTGESRLKNAVVGGVAGAGGVAAGRVLAAGAKGAKALFEPLTPGGRQAIAGRTLQQFGVEAGDVAGATSAPTVTGARTSLAEQITRPEGAAGAARLQDAVRSLDPEIAGKMTAREVENNSARVGTLRELAGEGGARDFAESMRNGTAKQLYGDAFKTKMDFKSLSSGERSELTKLLATPAVQDAMSTAKEIAANSGVKIGKTAEGSIEGLHLMKLSMDDAIEAAKKGGTAVGTNKAMSIQTARDRLVKFMERMSPEYRTARAEYAAMSKPLNQMDIAGEVLKKGTSATSDLGGTPRLMADKTLTALKDEGKLIKGATGRDLGGKLSDILEPDQLNKLTAVASELDKAAAVGRAANGPGSATAQRLSSQNVLRQVLGPTGLPKSWAESTVLNTAMRPIQFAYNGVAEPKIQAVLADLVMNPDKARAALAAATPAQRTKLIAVLENPLIQQAVRSTAPAVVVSGKR